MVNGQSYMSYLIVLIFCSYVFAMPKVETNSKENRIDYEINSTNTRLRLISMVFRHGDRTLDKEAYDNYPNSPYKNYDDYPNSNGLLTKIGKKRSFQFGTLLRKMYRHFLGDVYYPPNVLARSSAISRTKMTLQLVLAALYPPVDNRQRWNNRLDWQPVDTIYTSVSKDYLLFPYYCKEYTKAYINILRSKKVKTEIEKFNDTMEKLSKYVGKNITSIFDLFILYHTLGVQASMNLSLPEWSHNIFPRGKLYDATILQYKLYNYNNELIRLNGGKMLYTIIQYMNAVINGTLVDRKINLFSAHDLNVVALFQAMGIFEIEVPAFTSSVIVELREKNGKYFVQILRYSGWQSTMSPVQIRGCELLCPFEKFVRLTSATTATHDDPKCPLTITVY